MIGNKGLEIELKIPKDTYLVGEPIEVILVLKNRSAAPLTINKRMGFNPGYMAEGNWEVRFDITFPPGKRPLTHTMINPVSLDEDDFTVLPTGGELSTSITLTKYYWMNLPGRYNITATYHNTNDGSKFGLSAWSGEILSNLVSLNVTE
jgi:hypothetical protein